MKQFVDTLVGWGPLGILLLSALDSAGIPIPAAVDALLILLAVKSPQTAFFSAGLAVIGSITGSMFLFYVSRKGGEAYLKKHTLSENAEKFHIWFQTYGLVTVFIPALLPIPMPMKLFVISSGALGVKPLPFFLVLLAARVPRYFGLAYLGMRLGEGASAYLRGHGWNLAGFSVALLAALLLLMRVVERKYSAGQRP